MELENDENSGSDENLPDCAKIAGPLRTMAVLGAQVELGHRLLSLDPEKAASYGLAAAEASRRKAMRASEFLSLTCKLVHAAQYRPAGRTYLTSMFTALRRAGKTGASRVRIGHGAMRDLRWWVRALSLPNGGVAAFPRCHFPPSGSPELLEFAYGASGNEGMGGAMLRKDARGISDVVQASPFYTVVSAAGSRFCWKECR